MVTRRFRDDVSKIGVIATSGGGRVFPALLLGGSLGAVERRLAEEPTWQIAAPIVEEKTSRGCDDQIGQNAVAVGFVTGLFGEPRHVECGRLCGKVSRKGI